ncbi:DUF2971 domain-containing protein [Pseudovibrio ascidiaceicola]|uniref:DUF2971 domain-containing protein n=1 Tax=Pseudovibrio ascidiaceicola TaxID=285279 RepID=UPI000D692EEC|nr:DUF2971 domain-containing protein [Pseudovibrio ascidiaceicola]
MPQKPLIEAFERIVSAKESSLTSICCGRYILCDLTIFLCFESCLEMHEIVIPPASEDINPLRIHIEYNFALVRNEILPSKKRQKVFHYTDAAGLKGILETGKIWATHFEFLNDEKEILHGAELFKEYEEEILLQHPIIKSKKNYMHAEIIRRFMHDTGYNAYLFCTCKRNNKLNQFRYYSGSSGACAIEFNTNKLLSVLPDVNGTPEKSLIINVEYNSNNQIKKCRYIVELFYGLLDAILEYYGEDVDSSNEYLMLVLASYRYYKLLCCLSFKHSSFEEEEEIRFVFLSPKLLSTPTLVPNFRVSKFGLSPYLDINIWNPKTHEYRLPVKSITVGPIGQKELFQKSIELLLQKQNIKRVSVNMDSMPYRS